MNRLTSANFTLPSRLQELYVLLRFAVLFSTFHLTFMYLFIRNLDANSIPELVNISFPDTLQRL
jgi:hypothetical protein